MTTRVPFYPRMFASWPQYLKDEMRARVSDEWQGCWAMGISLGCAEDLVHYSIAERRTVDRPNGAIAYQYRSIRSKQEAWAGAITPADAKISNG